MAFLRKKNNKQLVNPKLLWPVEESQEAHEEVERLHY